MSGTITTGRFVVTEESFGLDDLVDVSASAPANNDAVLFKDGAVEAGFATGWHSTPLTTGSISGFSTENSAQNDLLAFNDGAVDPTYPTSWVPKNVSGVFTDLESTVNSIVGINTARLRAEAGDPGKTDMVLLSAAAAVPGSGSGTAETVTVGSNGPNNVVSKKEPSDGSFSFVRVLGAGERDSFSFPVGTVLRSTKGMYGFSGPLVTPLGPQSFALTQSQFYAGGPATLSVVSLGTEVTVTLLTGDRATTLAGPAVVAAYQAATLSCPSAGEFFVTSSGAVCASVEENGSNIRPLVPMSTEIFTFNSGCLVSALEAATTATFFRRDGSTGTVGVSPGSAVPLGAGSNTNLASNGAVRVTADKPIAVYTASDSVGGQVLGGVPVSQAAQRFCNPSFVNSSATYGESGVAIVSLFEGTATVFDASGSVVDTFAYTRSVAVTTAADQAYPAAGRWKPSDVSGTTTLDGGYIETNTPAVCVMNTSGDAIWGSTGQEFFVLGTTPEEIRADIKKDGNGIWRRRDISNAGAVSWNVC